ncbi:MAG: rhodanese-like domain-containing protein, partial [Solirubrobacterales bacterium]
VEFAGQLTAPCDPRPGRIPGARNVDVTLLLGAGDDADVRELVGEPAGAEVIAYCHSGSRSALAVQVLTAAGYAARNYVGSWHEWSRDSALPAETGPTG